MDGDSNDELFERKDIRKKKEKKRQHKSSRDKDDATKDSVKKMKEELAELRKREVERSKELADLKKLIGEKSSLATLNMNLDSTGMSISAKDSLSLPNGSKTPSQKL